MEENNYLYKEFLDKYVVRVENFFKNVKLFENQFKYSDFNETSYRNMYSENTYDDYRSVKYLKEKIEDLSSMCKKCGSFFIPKRNESLVHYDVQFGKLIEEIFIDYFKNSGLNVLRADSKNKRYPDLMLLSSSKQIKAYIEIKYHGAPFVLAVHKTGRFCYESSITYDFEKIVKQLEIAYSDLRLPVLYVHWVDFPCIKGIFFETSDQLKQILYDDKNYHNKEIRQGDLLKNTKSIYLKKFYSKMLYMGNFPELIKTMRMMANE
jgi:hypothetical protein